jgi:hypothetical protein
MRFSADDEFEAKTDQDQNVLAGEIYHVSTSTNVRTPIGRYFAWHPTFIEGFNRHWRIDCFVRRTPLAKSPERIGTSLVAALMACKLCSEPLWLSVYRGEEVAGMRYGDVFEEE